MRVSARHRKGAAVIAVLACLAAALVALAVRKHGYPTRHVDLNDGGIWVTSDAEGLFGRLNKPAGSLDLALNPAGDTSNDLDIVQDKAAVLAWDKANGRITPVSTADGVNLVDQSIPMPSTDQVRINGNTLAVLDPRSNKAWAVRIDDNLGITSLAGVDASAKPLINLGSRAGVSSALAVGTDGVVHVVGTDGTVATLTPKGASFAKATFGKLSRSSLDSVQATTVGSDLVALDATGGMLFLPGGRTVQLTADSGSVLQLPSGPQSDVALATPSRLITVPLSGGSPSVRWQGPLATSVAAPLWLEDCINGAWSGKPGVYVRACGSGPGAPVALPNRPELERPQFRQNRGAAVLNDLQLGSVFDIDTLQQVDNWSAVKPPPKKVAKKNSKNNTTTNAPRDDPPRPKPDLLGARPGRSAVLHVLDNDSDPQGWILSITAISNLQPADAAIAIAPDGQSINLQMPTSGSVSFGYTVDDGHGQHADTTVVVNPHPFGENGRPTLRAGFLQHSFTVIAGGQLDLPVLSDWRDPDSDPLVLTAASLGSGTATTTPDGRVNLIASVNGGNQTLSYTVDDGQGGTTTQKVPITVLAPDSTKTAAPVANADTAQGEVGKPITVEPLANDLPGADPTNPDAVLTIPGQLASPSGATVTTNLKTGEVTVLAARPGTFVLNYQAAFGNAPFAKAQIRVDVKAQPKTPAPPVAVPDTAVIYGQVPSTVDVLANDYDPAGGLLVVQRAVAADPKQIEVAVVDGHWLRVSAANPSVTPTSQLIRYTVTDGLSAPVTGEVTVTQLPPPADDTPVANADFATVRSGDSVLIPVLDNDIDPTGAPLSLVGNVTRAPTAGQLLVSSADTATATDRGYAYVSGKGIRYVAPATLRQPMSVRFDYVLQNPSGNTATGAVTVTVNPPPTPRTPDQAPAPQTVDSRVVAGDAVSIRIPTSGIDPDGDSATVIGITSAPTLGRITGFSATSISYEAFPTSSGPDSFGYVVTDQYGKTATAVVNIGVAPASDPQPPVAVDDQVTAAPGDQVQVDVLSNDVIAADDEPSILDLNDSNPDLPAGTKLLGKQGPLLVTAPENTSRPLRILYRLSDGIGPPSVGQVTVRSIAGYKTPPVAVDAYAQPKNNATTVSVDVLKNDSDPLRGRLTITKVYGAGARISGGDVIVPVLNHVQTIAYEIRNRTGAAAAAVIHVPPQGVGLPHAITGRTVEMDQDSTRTIDIADYVVDPGGHRLSLTLERTLSAAPATDLALASASKTRLKLISSHGYVGPAAISFEVTTGKSINDPKGVRALVTVPVQIGPVTPVLRCPTGAVDVVEGGAPTRLDVTTLCHVWLPDRSQLAGLTYTASWKKRVDAVSVTTNNAHILALTADGDARPGATGVLSVNVAGTKATASLVNVTVLPLGPPSLAPVTIDGFKAGDTATVNIGGYLSSPLRSPHPTLVRVDQATGDLPATVRFSGTTVTITPNAKSHGILTFRVIATDVSDTSRTDRRATGTITMNVLNVPDAPGAPSAGRTVLNRSVQLMWPTPASNGAPIDSYQVMWSGGSQTCAASPCLITGLHNGTPYPFRVRAHNAVGWGEPSPALAPPAVPDTRPGAVRNLRTSNPQDGTITLSWTPEVNEGTATLRHVISWSGGGHAEVAGTATSYQPSGLDNHNVYTFTVVAVNKQGPGPSVSTTGQSAGKPPAPPGMAVGYADQAGTSSRAVVVSWNDTDPNGPGPSTYTVTRNNAAICTNTTATSCSDTAPTGATYTYAVTATNAVGHVGPASTKTFEVAGTPDAPGNPQAASTDTDGQLAVSYTAPAINGTNGTILCTFNGGQSCGSWAAPAPGTRDTKTLAFGQNDADITVTLAAKNTQYTGASSSASGHTSGPPHTPNVSCSTSGQTITWTWNTPATVTTHPVNRFQLSGATNTTTGANSYSASFPQDGGSSTLQVAAIDSRGEQSSPDSATCNHAPKPDPAKLDVRMGGYTTGAGCSNGCHYVHVVGSGWSPGQKVSYVITWAPATDPGNYHYTATADGNGNIDQTPGPYYGGGNAPGGNGYGTVTANPSGGGLSGSCYGDWKNGGGCQ